MTINTIDGDTIYCVYGKDRINFKLLFQENNSLICEIKYMGLKHIVIIKEINLYIRRTLHRSIANKLNRILI